MVNPFNYGIKWECNGGIELKASDMNKRLTGDFSTDSLQQTLRIIEQTLDIKIK